MDSPSELGPNWHVFGWKLGLGVVNCSLLLRWKMVEGHCTVFSTALFPSRSRRKALGSTSSEEDGTATRAAQHWRQKLNSSAILSKQQWILLCSYAVLLGPTVWVCLGSTKWQIWPARPVETRFPRATKGRWKIHLFWAGPQASVAYKPRFLQ